MKLRQGRRNGRNLYVQIGDEPDYDNDGSVGMVDTDELAAIIVRATNEWLVAGGYSADYLYRKGGPWWRGDFPPGGP